LLHLIGWKGFLLVNDVVAPHQLEGIINSLTIRDSFHLLRMLSLIDWKDVRWQYLAVLKKSVGVVF
jgi:hypothetical protein